MFPVKKMKMKPFLSWTYSWAIHWAIERVKKDSIWAFLGP
jgi:hypothetical protein